MTYSPLTEHEEQVMFFNHCKAKAMEDPLYELPFAIPNQGKRSYRLANYFKSEGLKAGVPDIFVPIERGGFSGLFIEMKTTSGELSSGQRKWLQRLEKEGYYCVIAFGGKHAIEMLEKYLRSS